MTAPGLPAGWVASDPDLGDGTLTSTATPDTAPNAVLLHQHGDNLGSIVNGQTITRRFRMGSDEAVNAPGWNVRHNLDHGRIVSTIG